MLLLTLFQKRNTLFYHTLIAVGIINSICFSVLLIFIKDTIAGERFFIWPQYDWLIFFGVLILSVIVTKIFQTYLVKLTQHILYDYELNIVDRLRQTTLLDFQKIGSERVFTTIHDVRALALLPEVMVVITNSLIIIICALGYLFYTFPLAGLCMFILMCSLLCFYVFKNNSIKINLNKVRDLQDNYHKYLLDLLDGFKEIRMSSDRNQNMFNLFIKVNRDQTKELGQQTTVRYLNNELLGRYSWYFALGLIIYVLAPLLHMSVAAYRPFIVVVLYLMGPLSSLVGITTHLNNITIAIARIQALEKDLGQVNILEPNRAVVLPAQGHFKSLEFSDICFEYTDPHEHKSFRVGPLSLTIRQGELIFVTGGNGSGKSTFINLLTGLYTASSGSIYYNDQLISAEEYASYSDYFSAIFTNNHLFKENYDGYDLQSTNEELMQYVDMMQLRDVLQINKQESKIDTRLSKGQSKRLALIYALLEKRDLLVLDEWAAEQDPVFRAYFYEMLLANLIKKGKTIIAVTHDDYYFHHADRIIQFDYGAIIKDGPFHTNLHPV